MSNRLIGLLALVVLGILVTGSLQAQIRDLAEERSLFRPITVTPIGDDDDEGSDGLGFGKKIAGTWMGGGSFDLDFDCDGVVDLPLGIPVRDLHTIGVGGSYLVTTFNNFNTIHGTWKKTGSRQLTSEAIGFISDPNCADTSEPPDGVCDAQGPLTGVFSIQTILDFDDEFQNAATSFAATVHPAEESPLNPDAVVNLCTVGSHFSFKKVNVPLN